MPVPIHHVDPWENAAVPCGRALYEFPCSTYSVSVHHSVGPCDPPPGVKTSVCGGMLLYEDS